MAGHIFGGDWTEEKLNRIRKYLAAYVKIMDKQNFTTAYIDAFAGTGYRSICDSEKQSELLFPELAEKDTQDFLQGSAKIALQVTPRFSKYIFIENDEQHYKALNLLKEEHPELKNDIVVMKADANSYLKERCSNYSWQKHRAVLFLDPYGMEVEWSTIEVIAKTKAIDMWLLFPLGVAVNRLLRRNGKISSAVHSKLDNFFGASDWKNSFYKIVDKETLFGTTSAIEKTADFSEISKYFVKRLKTIFTGVAENPLPLTNSKNIPLFLLCFAAGNPKGAKTAIKIAQDILKR